MNLEETMQSIREFGDETLYILWTNADPVTANLMVFMYAENSMRYDYRSKTSAANACHY